MAAQFRSISSYNSGAGGVFNVAVPTGAIAGDGILFLFTGYADNADKMTTVPTGITLGGQEYTGPDGQLTAWWYGYYDGLVTQYTWNFNGNEPVMAVMSISGVDSSSFVSTSANTNHGTEEFTPIAVTLTGVTCQANDLLVAIYAIDSTEGNGRWSFSEPAGFIERYDSFPVDWSGMAVSTKAGNFAGASGNITTTATRYAGNGGGGWLGHVIAIKSAAGESTGIEGSGNITLAALTTTAVARLSITGSSNKTLAALTTSGAASLLIAGAVNKTLAALTTSSSASLDVQGVVNKTLAPLTTTAAASSSISASSNKTLAALTTVASSDIGAVGISAALNVLLSPLTTTSAASLSISATASATFTPLSSTAQASLSIAANASAMLAPLTSSSDASLSISANSNKTLQGLTSRSTVVIGEIEIDPGVIAAETPAHVNPFYAYQNKFVLGTSPGHFHLGRAPGHFHLSDVNPLLKN